MTIPRIIHQVWLGTDMPFELQRLCQTVRGENMKAEWRGQWNYILWNGQMLENAMMDEAEPYGIAYLKQELGSWASVSNYLRLKLLWRFGGVYLDCDFECFAPIDGLIVGDAGASFQDGSRICNAFMYATPQHPWIGRQLNHSIAYRHKKYGAEWGVYVATDEFGEDVTIVPRELVYPYLWNDPPEKRVKGTVLEHKWAKGWK